MSIITSEFNYHRKSHRVDIPLLVEINGSTYRAKDWSITGVGIEDMELWLKPEQILMGKLILPMNDSLIALNIELQFKKQHANVCGFEFNDISARNKRVLRHYIENAIEGKIDNIEDLISVVTTPSINSPIEDALNLTELEAEGLFREFKTKSYVSIALGILFLATIIAVLFYNTVYRIQTTGIISGNIERITANSSGIIQEILVKPNMYIDAGTTLFKINNPELNSEYNDSQQSLKKIDQQIDAQRKLSNTTFSPLLHSLEAKRMKKQQELDNAAQLFAQRIISIKDYSSIENQYQQANIAYQRELDRSSAHRAELVLQIEKLLAQRNVLLAQLEALTQRNHSQVVSTPVKGKVFHVEYSPGEYVTPDDVVVLIEKNFQPNVHLKLMTEDALKIKVGMQANVYVPSTDTDHQANVTAIGYSAINSAATNSQEASLNETLVRLEFEDPEVRLPANTRVKVWIKTF